MRIILSVIFLFGVLPESFAFIPRLGDINKCSKRNGNFPKPGSLCRSYYECKHWKAKEVTCPEDQHFFPARGYCVWADKYPCFEKPISKKCLLPNGKFLKPGTDCKKYYDCYRGVPSEKKCPTGLLFDHAREKCDWPELVHCPEDVKSTEKPSSPGVSTVGFITSTQTIEKVTSTIFPLSSTSVIPTTDSEKSSSDESSSSEEGSSSEENDSFEKDDESSKTLKDKSTSPSLYFSSKVVTKVPFVTTFPTIEEYSELPTTALSIGESSELPTTTSSTVESSELPTVASSIVESSELPTTAASIGELSELPTATSSIMEFSKLPTASSIVESSKLPTTISRIVESSELPTTASGIGGSSELPTTASSLLKFSELPTASSTGGSSELTTVSSIATEKECNSTSDGINIKENIRSTEIGEQFSSIEPETKNIASTTVMSETTDSSTINIFCPKPDGYFSHPNDKHKFIACVAGDLIIMECPSNLVYIHKKKACDYEKI